MTIRSWVETFITGDGKAQLSAAVAIGRAVSGGTGSAEAATVRVASDMTNKAIRDNFSIFLAYWLSVGPPGGPLRCRDNR